MIHTLLAGSMGSNCYILQEERSVVIDPGFSGAQVASMLDDLHIAQYLLINTHCHIDHLEGDSILLKKGVELAVHEQDADAVERGLGHLLLNDLFGLPAQKAKVDVHLRDGQNIDLGTSQLEVIHTPGHTPGSISLYKPDEKALFTGDTVFAGGVGRTDLAGGSHGDLKASVEKLIKLKDERGVDKIFPGHGPLGGGDELERVYKMFF
jgi:glyoxylase-like metal-dependent hydrolase (beta-lactamase superfamily II)